VAQRDPLKEDKNMDDGLGFDNARFGLTINSMFGHSVAAMELITCSYGGENYVRDE
jgi:hypothetical protein